MQYTQCKSVHIYTDRISESVLVKVAQCIFVHCTDLIMPSIVLSIVQYSVCALYPVHICTGDLIMLSRGRAGRWSHYMLIPLNLSDFDTDDHEYDDGNCQTMTTFMGNRSITFNIIIMLIIIII